MCLPLWPGFTFLQSRMDLTQKSKIPTFCLVSVSFVNAGKFKVSVNIDNGGSQSLTDEQRFKTT